MGKQNHVLKPIIHVKRVFFVLFFLHHVVFSGPAAFCQRSQRSVPVSLSTQHAQQSGARSAAVEAAGPGAEEVRVRPPCRAQLICPITKATKKPRRACLS